MAIVGYIRVSTHEQNLDLQIEAMEKHGYDMLYQEMVSGAKADRPEFEKCLNYLRKGDTLVVWRLDRFGRTLRKTLELVEQLEEKGVEFKSLQDNFDTSTASGRMFFHLCAVFAEYERNIMLERTYAGLAAAKAQGRVGGRKPSMNKKKIAEAVDLHKKGVSAKQIAQMMKCSKSTVFKYLQQEKLKTK
jgi:DNA invertase Pin-like site-specific DNA recombinase